MHSFPALAVEVSAHDLLVKRLTFIGATDVSLYLRGPMGAIRREHAVEAGVQTVQAVLIVLGMTLVTTQVFPGQFEGLKASIEYACPPATTPKVVKLLI